MYLYLCFSIFLAFSFFVGKIVVLKFNLTKFKHPLIYGVITYFFLFFILSFPLVLFHVSWLVFSTMQTLLHTILLAIILYYLFTKKLILRVSKNIIFEYIKNNWGLYTILFLFMFLYLISKNSLFFSIEDSRYNLAIIDNYVYIGKAANAIGSDAIFPLQTDILTGQVGPTNLLLLISYWELFWAYGSELFKIDLLAFVHTFVALLVYIITFFSIDEILYLLVAREKQRKLQIIMLSFILLYLFVQYDSDFAKFMFLPWYGNVISTMAMFPVFGIITYHFFEKEKMIIFYIFFPFVMAGFSPVSILYSAFLYLISGFYIMCKYRGEFKKTLCLYSFFISMLFFSFSIFNAIQLLELTRTLDLFTTINLQSEYNAVYGLLIFRLPIISIGIFLFYLSYLKKESSHKENLFVISAILILILAISPKLSAFVFNIFSFPFRRFFETILIYFFVYSLYKIFKEVNFKSKRLLLLVLVYSIFIFPQNGMFLLKNNNFYSLKNITNLERVTEISKKVTIFFENRMDKTNSICVYKDRSILTQFGHVDLGVAIVSLRNTNLIDCSDKKGLNEKQIDYIILSEETSDKASYIEDKGYREIETIKTDETTITIYGKEP